MPLMISALRVPQPGRVPLRAQGQVIHDSLQPSAFVAEKGRNRQPAADGPDAGATH